MTTPTQKPNKLVFTIEEAPVSRFLFSDVRFSWFWLILRVYVGYQWLIAGYDKLIDPAWVGAKAGTGIAGFVGGALTRSTCALPSVSTSQPG